MSCDHVAEDTCCWGWFVDPAAEHIGQPIRLSVVSRRRNRVPTSSGAAVSTVSILVAATTRTIALIAIGTAMYYMYE